MKLKGLFCLLLIVTLIFAAASCNFVKQPENKKFTVTFDSNGGTAVAEQTVVKGAILTSPTAPTKEGYTFAGWYNGEVKWDFNTPISQNMTLVAHWDEIVVPPCTHVDKDDNAVCDSCGEKFEDGIDVIKTYTITYMDGETELELTPASYKNTDTENLELPTAPQKAHYEFAGWFKNAELTEAANTIDVSANENLVFYASYVPVTYVITYSLDGGTNAEGNPATVTVEDLPLTLAAATKDGYDFAGWYTDYTCTTAITEINADNVGNITVYAKWEKVRIPRTVTYLDPEGNELYKDTFYVSTEDQPLREGIVAEGFNFIGWFDAVDTATLYTCIPAGTDKDIVLKARLVSNVKPVHEVLYYIDGKFHGRETFEEESGLAKLTTPSKGGYTFDGWYANEDCTGEKVTSIPANTTVDQTFYGKYVANEYTIKYYDGITGAELTVEPATYKTPAEAVALPAIAEKDGYVIEGWYDQNGQKYTEIAVGHFGDIVLTARYTPEVYTIKYVLYGGTNHKNNVDSYTYDPEGTVPTLEDPSRDGYLFAGWYTNPAYSGLPVEDLTAYENQDITLYAKWTPVNEGNGGGTTITPEVPFG